ncbi:MAG: energy transducer TonB [Alistipes sp.]|jgi:protein TonB|nr:energy transducer TonB [Alistipes sp.]
MEAKKTRRADLQNRRVLFIEIGLVLALIGVVAAFSWGQTERVVETMTETAAPVAEEIIINTEQEQRQPEVRPQPNQVISDFIDVVRNETQITTEYNFTEFSEDFVIEVPTAVVEEEAAEDIPIFNAEEMPTFQGGDLTVFRNWVQGRLQYPRMAVENNITGTVTLQFVIERDGSLTNVQELASPDRMLTEEAIRVLGTSPKWTPGKQRNRPVRVWYILPIQFRLETN